MRTHRRLALIALIALVALATACSNNTSPTGGGGPVVKELDSGNIANGGVYMHTFANAGTYNYHCSIHGGMTGQVVVAGGSPANAAVTITDNTFTPASAAVAPGGTVTWTNNGSTHTVTSD